MARAVPYAAYFVMLHSLGRANQRQVRRSLFHFLSFGDYFRSFFHQSGHALAGFRLGLLIQHFESLFQTLHAALGLFQVFLKRRPEIGILGGGFGHFRQRLHQHGPRHEADPSILRLTILVIVP